MAPFVGPEMPAQAQWPAASDDNEGLFAKPQDNDRSGKKLPERNYGRLIAWAVLIGLGLTVAGMCSELLLSFSPSSPATSLHKLIKKSPP
ncbi:hypothetical protein, partial [Mesorhizobium sp.]|uniref:hypothetical protein n=1 Tax=Mesorhizobium sp. TaxID=1871066 RepID=UPI00257EF095